jgi:hypothetical protein
MIRMMELVSWACRRASGEARVGDGRVQSCHRFLKRFRHVAWFKPSRINMITRIIQEVDSQ